jgi:dihydrofolate reductase
MKKLKLQVQMTVDGFVAGPNGELDWMVWDWDDALSEYVTELTNSIDTILLGRKMTDGFISAWSNAASDPANPMYEAGKLFIELPKVAFSRTMAQSPWENTIMATGELAEEISKLKNQDGKDLIVYGGASFVSSLIKGGHIDEYHLFVNPSVIGDGLTIFNEVEQKRSLTLVKAIPFACGIVLHLYEPAGV